MASGTLSYETRLYCSSTEQPQCRGKRLELSQDGNESGQAVEEDAETARMYWNTGTP